MNKSKLNYTKIQRAAIITGGVDLILASVIILMEPFTPVGIGLIRAFVVILGLTMIFVAIGYFQKLRQCQ